MKNLIYIFVLLFFVGCGNHTPISIPEAKDIVISYLSSATNQNGDAVIETISAESFEAWDRILGLARYANEAELKKERLYIQSSVLWIRNQFRQELKELTGKDYLRLSFSRGYNSKEVLNKLYEQTKNLEWIVESTGEGTAAITFKYKGSWVQTRGLQLIEAREGWRIDGSDQIKEVSDRIDSRWKESGMTKTEYLSIIYQAANGKPLTEKDWIAPFEHSR